MSWRNFIYPFALFLSLASPMMSSPASPQPSSSTPSVKAEAIAESARAMPDAGRSAGNARLEKFAQGAEAELRGDILPYWLKLARNREQGGFYGEISADSVVNPRAARGALLTSRILWTFSAAFRTYRDAEYKEMAAWAYRDLMDHFWDEENEGFFWTITSDGKPLDQRKHVYGQAFAVYGLSEYYRATADPAALARAVVLYRQIERHARDQKYGGYAEGFTRDWAPDLAFQKAIIGAAAEKSQNTHLHIMEAYASLLRVWPDPELRARTREIVELMLSRILTPDQRHLQLFFDETWRPVSEDISFGHDIEASWLLVETAEIVGDPALLAKVRAVAKRMADACAAEGIDRDGGVFNEAGPHGLIDRKKDWWPQAEAAVGFLNAYQLSGDTKDLAASERSWAFIQAKLIDRVHGEWFETIEADGSVKPGRLKVRLWKCPYHNGRACMELVERLHRLAAGADQSVQEKK